MMRLLSADPATIDAAANKLRRTAGRMDEQGRLVSTAAAVASESWTGAAAVACAGRAAQLRMALTAGADQLRVLATAASRYADQLAQAQATLRLLRNQERDVTGPTRVTGLGATVDPLLLQLTERIGHLEQACQGHARDLQLALMSADPFAGLPWPLQRLRHDLPASIELIHTAPVLSKVAPTASLVVGMSTALSSSQGAPAQAGAEQVSRALGRLRGAAPSTGLGWLPPQVLQAARRLSLAGQVADGARDVVVGDPAHPGWRDRVTRVLGGAGAVGGGALLIGVSNPIGATAAAAALTGYGLWKLGTAVYDHRDVITRGVRGIQRFGARTGLRLLVRGSILASRSTEAVVEGGRRLRAAVTRQAGHLADESQRITTVAGETVAQACARSDDFERSPVSYFDAAKGMR